MTNQNRSQSKQQLLNQIQVLEQNIQQLNETKQKLQRSLAELDSAAEHLDDTDTPHRLIGNILVAQKKEEVEDYVETQRTQQQKRVQELKESQERLQKQLEEVKSEVVEE